MAQLHLLIGPVAAGKSTFGRALAREHRAVVLNLDAWMATLYGDDERPVTGRMEWYLERTARVHAQIWALAQGLVELGTDVVLELGLIQRAPRHAFYQQVDDAGCALRVYMLDAPREVRRARTERRNAERGDTFAMVVPMEIFERASDMWQAPDDEELEARAITVAASAAPSSSG